MPTAGPGVSPRERGRGCRVVGDNAHAIRVDVSMVNRRAASGLSLVAHVAIVMGLVRCPSRAAPRLASVEFAIPRAAPPRLVFLMPPTARGVTSSGASRHSRPTRVSPTARAAASPVVTAADSTAHAAADTTLSVAGPPIAPRVDSASPEVVAYERPVHPALRGLVPMWNGGAIWRGMMSATSLVPALRSRPAECVPGTPSYFACVDRLQRWRDDSIYHVRVRCHDAGRVGQLFPSDCWRFRSDSTPD